jgi:hypothetical protein
MKHIIVIEPFHSLIDVITNSSTEIFICDTDKNEEAIKEMLILLGDFLECDTMCGVGEIYTIDESNIEKFLIDNHYYLHDVDIENEWSFEKKYYEKKGWDYSEWNNNSISKEERISHMEETYNAYKLYVKGVIDSNKRFYEKFIGKTVLVGKNDNSIPYDVWNFLNNKLNAYNIHCG